MPVFYVGAHKVHANQILLLFLVVPALHFLNHDCIGFKVVPIKIIGTSWKSTGYLLSLSREESEIHVLEAEYYHSVIMSGWNTHFVDKRIADAYKTLKTNSIR